MRIENVILEPKIFQEKLEIESVLQKEVVIFNNDELDKIWLEDYTPGDLFLVDRNVWEYVKTPLEFTFLLDATEDFKTIKNGPNRVMDVLDYMLNKGITKKNKLIVIGGGITQDVGAYVCSVYKRGLNWIFIPTTLLAMGDSSIGGKSGLNYGSSKNLIALFGGPNKVITNIKFLETLSARDIRSGISEIFKLVVIGGRISEYRKLYSENNYEGLIKLGLSIKSAIVEEDRFERNIRRVLNYGHTFGHALESSVDYAIPHGLAVAVGCYLINHLFLSDGGIYDEDILKLIATEKENLKLIDYHQMFKSVRADKKNSGNLVCFIVCHEGESDFIFRELTPELENQVKDCISELISKL